MRVGYPLHSSVSPSLPHPCVTVCNQVPNELYRVSFPGVKRPGRGVDHPPLSSAEVKERVELYLYSPSGSSWSVPGRNLPLPQNFNFEKGMAPQ